MGSYSTNTSVYTEQYCIVGTRDGWLLCLHPGGSTVASTRIQSGTESDVGIRALACYAPNRTVFCALDDGSLAVLFLDMLGAQGGGGGGRGGFTKLATIRRDASQEIYAIESLTVCHSREMLELGVRSEVEAGERNGAKTAAAAASSEFSHNQNINQGRSQGQDQDQDRLQNQENDLYVIAGCDKGNVRIWRFEFFETI